MAKKWHEKLWFVELSETGEKYSGKRIVIMISGNFKRHIRPITTEVRGSRFVGPRAKFR